MSHTTTLGLQTDLEHIEFARARYAAIVEAIRKDLEGTISPISKVALAGLLECAECGVRLAVHSAELLLNASTANLGSH